MNKLLSLLAVTCAVLILSTGCTGFLKGIGSIHPNPSVTHAFETTQINPDYHYFYSGSDVYPNAIIGLDKKYALEPDLWKKTDPAAKEFRDMISEMQTQALQIGQFLHGFTLLDDRGRPIGVWYSIPSAVTAVKMQDEKTALIYQPPMDTYRRHKGDKERLF
jgi:hypothetical protein